MNKVTNITLQEHRSPSAIAKGHVRRLRSQWYQDAKGMLVIRWVVAVEPDERHLHTALAA